METETWLDFMPAIPLARGVPVYHAKRGQCAVATLILRGGLVPGGEGAEVVWEDGEHDICTVFDSCEFHVDLDDPQGFGYALRCLLVQARDEEATRTRFPEAWEAAQSMWHDYAIQCGQVTDRDRLRLARALAEVMR